MNQDMSWSRIRPNDFEFEEVDGPAGRYPVRWLRQTNPYLVDAKIPVGCVIPAHWHRHDAVYMLLEGDWWMPTAPGTFTNPAEAEELHRQGSPEADRVSFTSGDILWLRAGAVYGLVIESPVHLLVLSFGGSPEPRTDEAPPLPADGNQWMRTNVKELAPGESVPMPASRPPNGSDHLVLSLVELESGTQRLDDDPGAESLSIVRRGNLRIEGESDYQPGDIRITSRGWAAGSVEIGEGGAELLRFELRR